MKMNHKDALNILGLPMAVNFVEIKAAYRAACSKYHPDRNPAGLEMMKLVNSAVEALKDYDYVKHAREGEAATEDGANLGEEMNTALNAIIHLGLTIEVCGSWIWVSGDTKPYKEVLKEAGFKWAPKKMMWHFRPADYKSYSRGKYTIDEIREKHGSVSVKPKAVVRLGAAA